MPRLRSESRYTRLVLRLKTQVLVDEELEQPISRRTGTRNEHCLVRACAASGAVDARQRSRALPRDMEPCVPAEIDPTAQPSRSLGARAESSQQLLPGRPHLLHTIPTAFTRASGSAIHAANSAHGSPQRGVARTGRVHNSVKFASSAQACRAVETRHFDSMSTPTAAALPYTDIRGSNREAAVLGEDPFPERTLTFGRSAATRRGTRGVLASARTIEPMHRARNALKALPALDPVPPSSPSESPESRLARGAEQHAHRTVRPLRHTLRGARTDSSCDRRSGRPALQRPSPLPCHRSWSPSAPPTGNGSSSRLSTSGRARLRAPRVDHQG